MAKRPPPKGGRPGGPRRGSKPGARRTSAPRRPPATQRPPARREAPDAGTPGHAAPERLQKLLAHAGIASRRACEELILQGRVTVDGQVVRELGTRVDPTARIAVDGESVRFERNVYYAVHKPKGYVSTNSDPSGRPRVIDLLPEVPERVYAVGRLDEQSTGLILLTNDGELANRLAHPKFGVEKVYRVVVAGEPGRELFEKLVEGVWLAEGKVRAKRVRPVARRGQATVLEMTLAEGKNREIRRMMARLGHKVMSLTRIAVGPVALKGLGVGQARPLTGHEVDLLRKVAAGLYVPSPRAPDRRPRKPRASTGPAGKPAGPGVVPPAPARGRPPARKGADQGARPATPTDRPARPAGRPASRPSGPPRRPERPQPAAGGPPPRATRRPPADAPVAGPPPAPAPAPPPKRARPPRAQSGEDRPRRIIIGLTPEEPVRPGPPGPRPRRPASKRPPRSALGVNRAKRPRPATGEGGDEPK